MNSENTYDIILRPHHVDTFINFVTKKLYLLSDEDFMKRFIRMNGNKYSEKFILNWKTLLNNLYLNKNIKFKYVIDFDTACESCNIKKECEQESSELHKYIENLDKQDSIKLSELEIGKIYKISDLKID